MHFWSPLFRHLWSTGGAISAIAAQWCHPVTVRGIRTFVPRVRPPRIEFGHVEDPNNLSVSD